MLFEDPVKVSQIIETRFVAGVEDVPGFAQSLDGEFDALAVEVSVESNAGDLLENFGESARRKLATLRHVINPQRLMRP